RPSRRSDASVGPEPRPPDASRLAELPASRTLVSKGGRNRLLLTTDHGRAHTDVASTARFLPRSSMRVAVQSSASAIERFIAKPLSFRIARFSPKGRLPSSEL